MTTDIPATPKDAATVVVMRRSSRGLELFCVERHKRSGFMGGALVFPGGKVDRSDHHELWQRLATELSLRTRQFAEREVQARAFAVAVLREALEEAAILPVVGNAVDADLALALRSALSAHAPGALPALAELLDERGLVLDTGRLEAVGRWITPAAEPKRFDTRFYLLALPEGQHGAHDDHETTKSFWATPRELFERWERREVMLAPPTAWTIGLFYGLPDYDAAFAVARRQSLAPVEPNFTNDGSDVVLTLPGDPLHPVASPAPEDPDAPTRFVLRDGRFVPARAR
jgi:8-oxo-dGTP pyrophosphatase MutT (NUDIX family)